MGASLRGIDHLGGGTIEILRGFPFFDGDQVLVQHTNHLQEGEIGIFVNGDAGYIKEYRKDGLYSHNTEYPPIRFSDEDAVRCIGRVLGTLTQEQLATPEEIAANGMMR